MELKFRVIHKGEILGYERISDNGWEFTCNAINPEGVERWTTGVFVSGMKREQYTGLKDCEGTEIYFGDKLKGKEDLREGAVVMYRGEISVERCKAATGDKYYYSLLDYLNNSSRKVVGNIHQNK